MAHLSFARLYRPGSTESFALDFVIDGASLYTLVGASGYDRIGLLGWCLPDRDRELVQSLLLENPTDLPGDRQSLFVCSQCGDIGCGAITARIEKCGDEYVWSDFAYQNNYDDWMTDRDSFAHIGPYSFPALQYREALLGSLLIAGTS